jgi:hypothetical protein
MHLELSSVLVEEHVQRLRESAQAPPKPLVSRIWAMVRRRNRRMPTAPAAERELERLAA